MQLRCHNGRNDCGTVDHPGCGNIRSRIRGLDNAASLDCRRWAVVTIDHPGVQLSAVKRADDSTGDLILRLHEACGDHVAVGVQTAQPIVTAFRCNALEEILEKLPVEHGTVVIRLRPFQLVTVRLATST